jgi:hypothetical protein
MDIKVKSSEWDQLDDSTKRKISDVISGTFHGSKIVADPSGASLASPRHAIAPGGNPFCELACNVAENTAKVACVGLGNPIAIAACIAAAEAAGRACRDRCRYCCAGRH